MKQQQDIQIFLLRGLARESRHWGEFLPALEKTGQIKTFPLDVPGSGTLRKKTSPTRIDDYLPPLREQFLRQTNKKAKNFIIGVSLGGMIAARWASIYPSDFQGIALINTSGRQSPFYHRMRPAAALKVLCAAFCKDHLRREHMIVQLICNMANTEAISQNWATIAADAPTTQGNFIRQLIAALTFSFPSQIQIPKLMLVSENDRLVNPVCSQKLSRILDIPARHHPTAGHDLTTDDPAWCVDAISHWISETTTT